MATTPLSITSGVKAPPAPLKLQRVALDLESETNTIRLSIVADGDEVYWERFKNWLTALDIAPQIARGWTYEVILEDHEGK